MAKKASVKKVPEVTPGENEFIDKDPNPTPVIVVEEAEVIELPMELAEIKKEYGLTVPDETVDKHILTYAPYFKELVDLETELTDLLTKEITPETATEAAALRKKYQKIRTGSKTKKEEDKKDILAEGKFLDTVFNRIKAGAEEKEAKCEEIEKHLEKLEAQRLEALRVERKGILEALDYDTDFLTVEDMSIESFNALVKKQTEIFNQMKKGEEERKREAEEQEKLRARKVERVNDLAKVGLFWNADTEKYEGKLGEVTLSFVESKEDEEFNKAFSLIEGAFNDEKLAEEQRIAAEREKAERITTRINALGKLGLTYDTVTETYTGFNQSMTLEYVKTAESQDFTDVFSLMKSVIDLKKADDKKADELRLKKEEETRKENERLKAAEAERVRKEKEELDKKQAAAKALELAPDKEKFKAFYLEFKALAARFPELTSKEGKDAGARFKEAVNITLNVAKQEAIKLV